MAVPESYKTVTCYLPPELADKLSDYCFKHEITRKNQQGKLSPSWGTGIVEALKLFFHSDPVPSPLPDTGLNPRMVEDLVKDSLSRLLPSQLPNHVPSEEKLKELIQESVTNLLPSLLSSQVLTDDSPILKGLDNRVSQLEANQNQLNQEDNREVTLISSEGEEIIAPESLPSSANPEVPSKPKNDEQPIDGEKEATEGLSESGKISRFTDPEVQGILLREGILKTSTQNLKKWRKGVTTPRGLNKKIFDHFKPDGDRWTRLK